MAGEKPKKKNNQEIIHQVTELAHLGYNDSQIGREVGIHRTTVKRYREKGEKRAIGAEARIRVIQESLSRHFDALCQTCEKLQSATIITTFDKPEKILVEDLQSLQTLAIPLSGRRGDETKVVLKAGRGQAKIDHLSLEEDLLFASLRQHTRNLDLWKFFQQWKDQGGEYISNLSRFYGLLKQQALAKTGLIIADSEDKPGLTPDFARTIFTDACNHALFGYVGFEGVAYAIISLPNNRYELRLDGYTIASASDQKRLEKCQELHSQMLDYYRDSRNQPEELHTAIEIRPRLQNLESEIFKTLQKWILKRSFLGRCELCPD